MAFIDLHVVDAVLRVFMALAQLALAAAAGWGFLIANDVFLRNMNLGVYVGIMAVYYSIFGVLGVLAELRLARVDATALAYLTFLHAHAGRGAFAFYTGSTFLFIPWDVQRPWIPYVAGGLLIGAGVLQIAFAPFAPAGTLAADRAAAAGLGLTAAAGAGGGKAGAGGAASAAAVSWGSSAARAEDDGAPIYAEPDAARSPGALGGGVVMGNPFLAAARGNGTA